MEKSGLSDEEIRACENVIKLLEYGDRTERELVKYAKALLRHYKECWGLD